jgi:hypothetical protein
MDTDSIHLPHFPCNPLSARQQAIAAAATAYRAALFDFAEGRISWSALLERCRALRSALRSRRNSVAG